jgi:2-dehydropantoate 2-reductase
MASYVIGAGAIGLFVQYVLDHVDSPLRPVLICRSPSYQKLKTNPLRLTGAITDSRKIQCAQLDDVSNFDSESIIYIATKAHEAMDLLKILPLDPNHKIVLCQNGIGIYDQAKKLLPNHCLIRLLCWMGTRREDVDCLAVAGIYKFEVAGDSDNKTAIEQIAKDVGATGVTVTTSNDPHLSEWKKSLWNITVNGLCSIADAPNGAILDDPDLKQIADQIADETISVANSAGIGLGSADKNAVFDSLEKTRSNINATLQDLRAGRHPELEFLNGAVVDTARIHDQKAPLNETIVHMISYLEKSQKRREFCHD